MKAVKNSVGKITMCCVYDGTYATTNDVIKFAGKSTLNYIKEHRNNGYRLDKVYIVKTPIQSFNGGVGVASKVYWNKKEFEMSGFSF